MSCTSRTIAHPARAAARLLWAGLTWACLAVPPAGASVVNRDFSTGDFSGWTFFTTSNGVIGIDEDGDEIADDPSVVPFDWDDFDLEPSLTARFRVGQLEFAPEMPEGGGIFQSVNLLAGDLAIDVEVGALRAAETAVPNAGLFELLFDGAVVDSLDVGFIDVTEEGRFGELSATLAGVAEGPHEIRVRMTRPFVAGLRTPYQIVDDIVLSGTAVPEPTALLLRISALATLAGLARRRRSTRRAVRAAAATTATSTG